MNMQECKRLFAKEKYNEAMFGLEKELRDNCGSLEELITAGNKADEAYKQLMATICNCPKCLSNNYARV